MYLNNGLPITANGSTAPIVYNPQTDRSTIAVWGTFDGGTMKLQASPDNGVTWIDVDRSGSTNATFTANGLGNYQINIPCLLRATLTGATAPSLYVLIGDGLPNF